MKEVTFGDTVQVIASAPQKFRPGNLGEVVAITEANANSQIYHRDVPRGGKYYLIEFGDGDEIEIPEIWISMT